MIIIYKSNNFTYCIISISTIMETVIYDELIYQEINGVINDIINEITQTEKKNEKIIIKIKKYKKISYDDLLSDFSKINITNKNDDIDTIDTIDNDKDISFTDKEIENYKRQKEKCIFKTPKDEYLWAKEQNKTCSKCLKEKKLCDFNGNTSGTDAFDKSGYRLRRPECIECTKLISKGKSEAKKKAKELGISYIAPEGTLCGICNKPESKGNCIVFDHCHKKNIFRGYCCNSCNRSLGVLGDDIDGILRVLNYLLKNEECNIIQNENGEVIKC